MKTKLFTLIMLLVVSLTAFAQKKVAVYVTGQESGINKVLGDQLVAAFVKSGKYIAIERTASFLAELSKEQSYQRSGAVSDREIAALGVQFGVQLVCVVDVSDVFGQKYVSARLIDVENAEVINSSNASSALNSMDDLLEVSSSITTVLTGKTAKELAEEKLQSKKEREKMFQQAFENGYIRIGNIHVMLSTVNDDLYNRTIAINVGGFHNWRAPTVSEIALIYRTFKQLSQEASEYSLEISSVFANICYLFERGESFRASNGAFYRNDGGRGDPYKTVHLLPVRDINE